MIARYLNQRCYQGQIGSTEDTQCVVRVHNHSPLLELDMVKAKVDRMITFGTAKLTEVKTSTYKGISLVHKKRSDREDFYRIESIGKVLFSVSGTDVNDALARAKRCVDRYFELLEQDRLRREARA